LNTALRGSYLDKNVLFSMLSYWFFNVNVFLLCWKSWHYVDNATYL